MRKTAKQSGRSLLGAFIAVLMIVSQLCCGMTAFADTAKEVKGVLVSEYNKGSTKVERTGDFADYQNWFDNIVSVEVDGVPFTKDSDKPGGYEKEDFGIYEPTVAIYTDYGAVKKYVIKSKGYKDFVWQGEQKDEAGSTPSEEPSGPSNILKPSAIKLDKADSKSTQTLLTDQSKSKEFEAWLKNIVSVTINGESSKFSYDDFSYLGLDPYIDIPSAYDPTAKYVIKAKGYFDFVWQGKELPSKDYTDSDDHSDTGDNPGETPAVKKALGDFHTVTVSNDKNPCVQVFKGKDWQPTEKWMESVKEVYANGEKVKFAVNSFFDDDLGPFGFHYMDIITDKAELRNLIIKSPKYEDFIELFGEGAVGEKSIIAAPGAFTSPESVRADFTKVDISIKGTEKVLAYDIFLRDLQGNKVKPNKPVKVCIRIPKGSGTPDHVYHIVNGKRTEEKFALEEDGGYVVFETADFSEWAIVWGDPAEEVNTGDNQATGDQTKPADNAGKSANKSEVAVVKSGPSTGDANSIGLYSVLAVAALAGMYVFYGKKRGGRSYKN